MAFRRGDADLDRPVTVACGKCEPCAESRGVELAARIYHDWQAHSMVGCFGTLTYSDEHLPADGRLCRRDAELFVKRIDKRLRSVGSRWRGVLVGEYGDRTHRAHYHFVLLGHDLSDRLVYPDLIEHSPGQFISPALRDLWPLGQSQVSEMHPARAKYMGKHFVKNYHDPDVFRMLPRRPGLGRGWLSSFWEDCRKGFVVIDGCKMPIPRAYLARPEFRAEFAELRESRRAYAAGRRALSVNDDLHRRESIRANVIARRALVRGVV